MDEWREDDGSVEYARDEVTAVDRDLRDVNFETEHRAGGDIPAKLVFARVREQQRWAKAWQTRNKRECAAAGYVVTPGDEGPIVAGSKGPTTIII